MSIGQNADKALQKIHGLRLLGRRDFETLFSRRFFLLGKRLRPERGQDLLSALLDFALIQPAKGREVIEILGLDVREVRHDREGVYHTLIRVTVATSQGDRSVAGTVDATANAGSQPGQPVRTSGEVDQKKDQKK